MKSETDLFFWHENLSRKKNIARVIFIKHQHILWQIKYNLCSLVMRNEKSKCEQIFFFKKNDNFFFCISSNSIHSIWASLPFGGIVHWYVPNLFMMVYEFLVLRGAKRNAQTMCHHNRYMTSICISIYLNQF